jgi:hypothetical protein
MRALGIAAGGCVIFDPSPKKIRQGVLMDCPHCGKSFHDTWNIQHVVTIDPKLKWCANSTVCPACSNPTIQLLQLEFPGGNQQPVVIGQLTVYPANTFRKSTPLEVPSQIKEDYEEACRVLPISPKAAAALARRCLQAILREQGYSQRDLAQQIDALLNEPNPAKAVPTALRSTIDAVRNFGNFSAHPVNDQTTLQVIEVEHGEAEWCLDILEEMFDHYYVKPEQAKARMAALDAKLVAARNPLSK